MVDELFYSFFFHTKFSKASIFYAYGTSHFGLATIQGLNGHLWLVATELDSAALGNCINTVS